MYRKMKILGFVPARSGSKGIPQKNICRLNGKPLIAYTIEEAKKSTLIDRLMVSTDSEEIAEISRKYGAEVPFLRPVEIAGDTSTIEEALLDALKRLTKLDNYKPEIIVLLQPTSPLRKAIHIDESINLLIEKGADCVVSVSKPMEHPCDMVYWDPSDKMQFLFKEILIKAGKIQRQDYPECYFLTGALYTFTYEGLIRTESRFGPRTVPYIMKGVDSIDIDAMDDLVIAESILMRREKGPHEK